MKDFNFFSSFIEDKKSSRNKYRIIAVISAFIVFVVAVTSYINISKIKDLEVQVADLEEYLNSKEVTDKLIEVKEKKRKINIVKDYLSVTEEINRNIDDTYLISSQLIENIAATFPKELFIKSISLTPNDIQLQGVSSSRISIAELQHNLKDFDIFDRVNVSVISKESRESDNYNYSMTCTFKGVENDKAK